MRLNDLAPGAGARTKRKRAGRGIGSGLGKTCGHGHKGQRSRSGNKGLVGFEGGQMPLQRRLPKFGFTSRKAHLTAEVRLDALSRVSAEVIDIPALKAAKLVSQQVIKVKLIASGELAGPVTLRGIAVTKGARAAVESAGGRIED